MKKRFVVLFFIIYFFVSCVTLMPKTSSKKASSGFATYNTDEPGLRAAHADLEFDTRVRVTNLNNQQTVIVTITDRIPLDSNWIIHIGKMAGDNIRMSKTDATPVKIEVLGRPKYSRHPTKTPSEEAVPGIIDETGAPVPVASFL